MTNMNGVFYPSGHVFALFQDEECVRQCAAALQAAQQTGEVAYASPQTIRRDITHTLEGTETVMPSVGADNDIVRRIDDLARRDHHGLLIQIGEKDAIETVTAALVPHGAAAAFYYRTFVIEELVEQPVHQDDQSVYVGNHGATPEPQADASKEKPFTVQPPGTVGTPEAQ